MPPRLPTPVPPEDLVRVCQEVIKRAKFPFFATMDGDQPRVRPVSPVRVDGFTFYIANLRSYGKTRELAANPKVELCFLDENHDQVRITGTAETVTHRPLLEDIWSTNPLLRQYLGSLDNPELVLYCIRPNRVRFMREWALEYQDVPFHCEAYCQTDGNCE